ncbi:hypothetical protein F183_A20820 [Bryobacterales bacterium F-183]|nr:hypothetical protein F183_A20820 [Bryobacterales bacterium F-183]
MIRLFALLLCASALAQAHVVSMSEGELKVTGATATFRFGVPWSEVSDIQNPEATILNSFRFGDARRIEQSCRQEEGFFRCDAKYLFPQDAAEFDVECRLASATVASHIHILRATNAAGKTEQAYFDLTVTRTRLTFREPTATEKFLKASFEGLRVGITGVTTALFLFAIAITAKDRRQFLTLAAILIGVELALNIAPTLRLSLRFLEAAAALSITYLAVEKLLVPDAGQRWLVVATLGIFHGLLFRFFNQDSRPAFTAGLFVANLIWLAPAALLRYLPSKPLSMILAAVGFFWFAYTLLG